MKGIDFFRPNDRTHAEFGEVLREAQKVGVGSVGLRLYRGRGQPAAGCAGGDQAVDRAVGMSGDVSSVKSDSPGAYPAM